MAQTGTRTDAVDALVSAAGEAWPELDARTMAITARLARTLGFIYGDLEAVAADFGISIPSLEALLALRLSPAPHRLSQRALGETLMRTSGTLSVRLARLERAGLIAREPDPFDARGILVGLTRSGRRLVDKAIAARLESEAKLLETLTGEERDQLSDLLRKLLVWFERREAGPRLGIVIAPRRAAKRLRSAYGVADGVGLLVAAVEDGSLAARAGMRAGDLIVRLGGGQLRSAAQLKRALVALEESGAFTVTILREGEEGPIEVTVAATRERRG